MRQKVYGCLGISILVLFSLLIGMLCIQNTKHSEEKVIEEKTEIGFEVDMKILNLYQKYEIDKEKYPFYYLYISIDNKEFLVVDSKIGKCIQGVMLKEGLEDMESIYANQELNYLICKTDKGNIGVPLEYVIKGEKFPEKETIKLKEKISTEELLELKLTS